MPTVTRPRIGSYSFITKEGTSDFRIKTQLSNITRENVDGHAFVDLGEHAEPVTWVTEVDSNAPETLQDQYEALQGTLVTVYDEDGKQFANVMVLKVKVASKKNTVRSVGGVTPNGAWIVTAEWLLQGTQ